MNKLLVKPTLPVLLVASIFSIVAGCSGMKGTRRPMTDGEKLFRANCRSCHVLPKPTEKDSNKWPEFLNAHSEDKDIEPDDLEKIVEFLQNSH